MNQPCSLVIANAYLEGRLKRRLGRDYSREVGIATGTTIRQPIGSAMRVYGE